MMVFDALSKRVIGCALEVHKELGPGLLESTYEQCLARELALQGIAFATQVEMPVEYKGVTMDCGYRLDIVVESVLVVEVKAVSMLDTIHEAQLIAYLKLSKLRTGLLINFNVKMLKEGIRRFVV